MKLLSSELTSRFIVVETRKINCQTQVIHSSSLCGISFISALIVFLIVLSTFFNSVTLSLKVTPTITGSILTLSAPGMISMSIDLSRIQGKGFRVAVWGQPVIACDCGEEPARWLSRFVLQEDTGFRLVYYPLEYPTREIRARARVFLATEEDTGAYPDATSYCLINEASVTDLNTRLDEPVSPDNFRPNFVVKGATPYEEDTWAWVKIGNVIFRAVMPCTRCIFTTINPETGIKNPKTDPLKTLKSYRQITEPAIRKLVGESPVLGVHLGLRGSTGTVRLGDPVYVGIPSQAPIIPPPS